MEPPIPPLMQQMMQILVTTKIIIQKHMMNSYPKVMMDEE